MNNRKASTVITGIGIICPSGVTKDIFYHSYLSNTNPVSTPKNIHLFGKDYIYAVYDIPPIEEPGIPSSLQRRMRSLSLMVVVSAWRCLQDSGLEYSKYLETMGIVMGTGWGEIDSIHSLLMQATEKSDILISPTLFHTSVHNAPAGHLGIALESKGPTLTVTQGDQSFESALSLGNLLLQSEQCPVVLVGGADTFFDLSVLEKNTNKDTLSTVSKGSCFFLLEPEKSAIERNTPVYARTVFLPSRTTQNQEQIHEYACDIKASLSEQSSGTGEPIDLVVFTGVPTSFWHIEIPLIKAILEGKSAYLIPPDTPLSRPTQTAEDFLGSLAILEKQKIPDKKILYLTNNELKDADSLEDLKTIKRILLISVSSQGTHSLFLLEKLRNRNEISSPFNDKDND